MNDVIGFAAILGAGFWIGNKYGSNSQYAATDFLLIAFLLAVGFFFAVILS